MIKKPKIHQVLGEYKRCILILMNVGDDSEGEKMMDKVRAVIDENMPSELTANEYMSGVWEFGYGMEQIEVEYIGEMISAELPQLSFAIISVNAGGALGTGNINITLFTDGGSCYDKEFLLTQMLRHTME